ncbi:MAG: exo-alpha-sialidase [Clostridia bacterium]|nr:exo-alpha-sialidase [Clostridia bacterium]
MKLLKKEFIYDPKTPVNIPSCHAATLSKTDYGILAAWFGGTHEGHNDVQIYVARRYDADGTWSAPQCVSTVEPIPNWNPVLYDNGEEILLYYKRSKNIDSWNTMFTTSRDGGYTWSEPRRLCEHDVDGRGPVKNKPIRLSNGTILAGASFEQGPWRCFCDISADNGYTWEETPFIPVPTEDTEVIQPSLWEDDRGVHMLVRSKNKKIFRSDSTDFGKTWCTFYDSGLPNNNSGLDLVKVSDNRIILCCNPVTEGRTPLSLFESTDSGDTFVRLIDLETEPGEYSYPAVITDGKYLYGAYTWKREKMVFFRCDLSE